MIEVEKASYPVSLMCRVLGLGRSGFHAWRSRGPSRREREEGALLERIRDVYVRSRGTYGSPRVQRELLRQGVAVGHGRVERLMREHGLRGRKPKRFRRTTDSKHGLSVAPNLLARQF